MASRWILCEPGTVSVTQIYEGETVVTGGPDGQAWIATFADEDLARAFVNGLRKGDMGAYGLRPVKPRSRKAH